MFIGAPARKRRPLSQSRAAGQIEARDPIHHRGRCGLLSPANPATEALPPPPPMDFEALKVATLEFVRAHQIWAPFIVAGLAFCESLAFLSLLVPATVILVG